MSDDRVLFCGNLIGPKQYCARPEHEGPCVVPRELPDDAFAALPLIDDVLAARGLRHVGYVEKGGTIRPVEPASLATDQAALAAIREAALSIIEYGIASGTDNTRFAANDIAHAVATALDELAAKRAAR